MKKITSIILCLVLLFSFAPTASASEAQSSITPQITSIAASTQYISSTYCDAWVSGSKGVFTASIDASQSTSLKIVAQPYKWENDKWVALSPQSKSATHKVLIFDGSFSVTAGVDYKIIFIFSAGSDTITDTQKIFP